MQSADRSVCAHHPTSVTNKIAFTYDSDIWLMDPTEHRTKNHDFHDNCCQLGPRRHPDRFYQRASDTYDIWVMNVDAPPGDVSIPRL